MSGKSHLRTIRIVVGIIRRCGRHIEHGYRTQYREQLHGAQFDVGNGRSNGNVIGDFRHAALYLDGRQRQHPICRGHDRNVALIGHRQYVVLVGVCNGEILPQQIVAQIAAQIGGNAHPVVARQAFETQRRRGLVTVQDNIAVIVVKVEVQVADGRFIHRAGYGGHPFGPYRQADKDTAGICTFCPVLGDTAPQKQDGSEYQQIFFHSRKNLKKGLKKAPAREGRELPKQEGYAPSSTFCVTGVSQSATVTDTAQS